MYGRSNAEELSLSIGRSGNFDNASSMTIINNDKLKDVNVNYDFDNRYRWESSKCPPLVNKPSLDQPDMAGRGKIRDQAMVN